MLFSKCIEPGSRVRKLGNCQTWSTEAEEFAVRAIKVDFISVSFPTSSSEFRE